jgi:hypothetical protein
MPVLVGQTRNYVDSNDRCLRDPKTLNAFPVAPTLPKGQKDLIAKLGKLWFENPERPRPKRDVRCHWEKLVEDWAETDCLPLFVRKPRGNRGSIINHEKEKRPLIPTDNSPAIWAFVLACTGEKPSLKRIKDMVDRNRIPIAFALSKKERRRAQYVCDLHQLKKDYPNCAGWKFAHIEDIGLKCRGELADLEISRLKNHFKNLLSLSNMFVIPKKYGHLAEIPEFREQMKPTNP